MPTCAVPGCTSGYASNHEKVHCFKIPKDPGREEIWKRAIKRQDSVVRSGRTVCEKHFRKSDIIWQRQLLSPDGRVLGVSQYKVPRLKQGVVPSIFSWTEGMEDIDTETEKYIGTTQFQNTIGNNEENPSEAVLHVRYNNLLDVGNEEKKCITDILYSELSQKHDTLVLCKQENEIPAALEDHECAKKLLENQALEQQISFGINSSSTLRSSILFMELIRAEISLPDGWMLQIFESTNLLLMSLTECKQINGIFKPIYVKAIIIQKDMSIEIVVLGMPVNSRHFDIPSSISEVSQLQGLLLMLHGLNVCNGCAGLSALTVMTETEKQKCKALTKDVAEQWRHKTCSLLLSGKKICNFCQTAKKTLSKRLRRWQTGEVKKPNNTTLNSPRQEKRWIQFQSEFRAVKRSRNRAKNTVKHLRAELRKVMRKK